MTTLEQHELPCTAALLTTADRGAVATVAVNGLGAASLLARYFQPFGKIAVSDLAVSRVVVGYWHNATGTAEEVVVCRRSSMGFEVNCHGGEAASEAILESLVLSGATRLNPAEWLQREVRDPVARAAWMALSQARTPRAAAILLDQLRGAFGRRIGQLNDRLRQPADSTTPRLDSIEQPLERMLSFSDLGLHLTRPWRVVFAGPPNVGKSSLVNAILGYERAIVFDQPGTTRDVLAATTAIHGWEMELADTAGIRDSSDLIEAEGVARARSQLGSADLVVYITDARDAAQTGPLPPLAADKYLLVANKCDLLPTASESPATTDGERLFTSARSGAGLDRLLAALVRRLVPREPSQGEPVPFTAEQIDGLSRMLAAVRMGDLTTALEQGEALVRPFAAADRF